MDKLDANKLKKAKADFDADQFKTDLQQRFLVEKLTTGRRQKDGFEMMTKMSQQQMTQRSTLCSQTIDKLGYTLNFADSTEVKIQKKNLVTDTE